jgi:hypothetical protein
MPLLSLPTKSLMPLLLRSAALVLLGSVAWWLWSSATTLREEEATMQQTMAHAPLQQAQEAAAAELLAKHDASIKQIQAMVVQREGIGEVITALETQAAKRTITLRISDISEDRKYDAAGKEIEPSGPLRDIRIKAVAIGDPHVLVDFVRVIEHLPYLLRVVDWKIAATSTTSQTVGVGEVPRTAASPTPRIVTGELHFTLLVSIHHEAP